MARRLTTFSKFLITLLILASIFFLARYVMNNTEFGRNLTKQTEDQRTEKEADRNSGSNSSDDNTLRVQLVTWGGYAPGLYFNEGAAANTRSRFYKDYGFKVDFKLENDLINAMNAWIADEYDVIVQTADAFPLYTSPDDINQFNPKAFIQVDWSRGGDAIIVKRGINSINDLKGKKVAVAVPSPAQTLLFSSLNAAGLDHNDVQVIKTSDNLKAAELFRSPDVDAAVVWSPDDIIATRDVPGSKILLTTREQSHIIADIMLAKEEVIQKKKEMFTGFYEGWMRGVAELKNESNQEIAAKYLAEMNGLSVDDAKGMMANVYWTGHGDNQNFFGLNPSFKGQKMADIYGKMNRKFVETGDIEKEGPNWRSVINSASIQNAQNLSGTAHQAESSPEFSPSTSAEKTLPAFATKPLSINFATGQYQLTENAKTIIDLQFADIAKSFANVKVRVEGNTDNVGARAMNMKLSEQRAQSVARYLQSAYSLDRNRFVIVGNGPDKPTQGCETNATQACKAKNRRTEFQLIAG
jgi:NitT/TauT family transport system substrate-binding protein